jgi:hypothetical protein
VHFDAVEVVRSGGACRGGGHDAAVNTRSSTRGRCRRSFQASSQFLGVRSNNDCAIGTRPPRVRRDVSHNPHCLKHHQTFCDELVDDRCRSSAGADVLLMPSSVDALRAEHRQLPAVGALIVADEIGVVVRSSQFEVPVVWRQPGVEHFGDGDATISKNERAWRLLAAVACVALDTNAKQLSLSHRIIVRRPRARSDSGTSSTSWPSGSQKADSESHVSRGEEFPDRGVRWRRGCYPAVTPALELVRFAFHDRANRRCSLAGRAACKPLEDPKIRL